VNVDDAPPGRGSTGSDTSAGTTVVTQPAKKGGARKGVVGALRGMAGKKTEAAKVKKERVPVVAGGRVLRKRA
ncbi:hypothetical protein LTR66_013417, partial [Elasticomyces elasticus]